MYRWCVHACDGVSVCVSLFGFGQLISGILCAALWAKRERDRDGGRPPHSIVESIRHTQQTPLSYTQFDCITNQMRIFVLVNFPECAFDAVCNAAAFYSFPISVSSTPLAGWTDEESDSRQPMLWPEKLKPSMNGCARGVCLRDFLNKCEIDLLDDENWNCESS